MLYVIEFRDDAQKKHLRPELMDKHLAFLRGLGQTLRTAGSLRRQEDDAPVGGLWIVEADDFDHVRRIYQDDPFWTAGLRASVEVHRLAKAFPHERREV